jgi:hypothetical protein
MRAAARYQQSRQGKLKHAARQSRYREGKKEIVTHKGSKILLASDLLAIGQHKMKLPTNPQAKKISSMIYCESLADRLDDVRNFNYQNMEYLQHLVIK